MGKANHGFDILTQGIGMMKPQRSLLTGRLSSPTQTSQTTAQEIQTLMAAAQTAAKPSIAGLPSEEEDRVSVVDPNTVSAAERYRMPQELFQPDEEPMEKPRDDADGLPSSIFQPEETPEEDDD